MMSSDILERRKKCFQAWNTFAKAMRTRKLLPNPLHDRSTFAVAEEDESASELEAELAAWEQASDDAFEDFEQSI